MIESKTVLSRDDRTFLDSAQSQTEHAERQRRMMAAALGLLVIGLVSVLYLERDFWFSTEEEAQTQSAAVDASAAAASQKSAGASHNKKHSRSQSNGAVDAVEASDLGAVTATRTVLPPMQVEVIASTYRRTIHPGTNSVMIDLRNGSASSPPVAAVPQSDAARNDSGETAPALPATLPREQQYPRKPPVP